MFSSWGFWWAKPRHLASHRCCYPFSFVHTVLLPMEIESQAFHSVVQIFSDRIPIFFTALVKQLHDQGLIRCAFVYHFVFWRFRSVKPLWKLPCVINRVLLEDDAFCIVWVQFSLVAAHRYFASRLWVVSLFLTWAIGVGLVACLSTLWDTTGCDWRMRCGFSSKE